MIKRFKSKGIMGIPDCDIKLGSEKKIIITGPNGSGKTSLLKQITHPLASHDRINRLKQGVEEGFTEMEIEYYGRSYKVQHIYTRSKPGKSPKVMSYLFKLVNGGWLNLVENGLPTLFKAVVENELDYSDYLYEILNIGSHNKGIIDQTNANRLDYLKKVTNQDMLTIIKENVNNNFTQYSNNKKYISNEISKLGNVEDMTRRIKILQNEALVLSKDKENLSKELAIIENTDDSLIDELTLRKNDLNEKYYQLDILLRLLSPYSNDFDKVTYYIVKNTLDKSYVKINTKLDNITERIVKLNEDLLKVKEMDTSELIKERDEIKNKIKNIEDNHKGKTYPEIDNDSISKYIFTIEEQLIPIIVSIDGVGKAKSVLKDDSFRKLGFSTLENIEKINQEITKVKSDLENLSFSKNLIKLDYPKECQFPKCKLRVEYEEQIEKMNVYQILNDTLLTKEKERDNLNDLLLEEERLKNQLIEFTNILYNNKIISMINNNFKKVNIEDTLDVVFLYKITDKLKSCKIYNMDMIELDKLNTKLESLSYVVKSSEDNTRDKLNGIKTEISELEEEEKELKSKLYTLDKNLNKFKEVSIDESLYKLDVNSINEEKTDYLNKIDSIDKEIEKISNMITRKRELNDAIIIKNKELQTNTDEYYKLKETINRVNLLSKDFSKTNEHVEKLKVLREVVSRLLPAKILESYLIDISKLVNYLLEDSMRIRFDTTDGIEIYCTIRGEERPVSVMSQGEKSILSVALLIAFKKMIKWDVISIDEGSAALDEDNTDRFMNMITRYIEAIDTVNQVFIVSHDFFVSDGMDIRIIKMENL